MQGLLVKFQGHENKNVKTFNSAISDYGQPKVRQRTEWQDAG